MVHFGVTFLSTGRVKYVWTKYETCLTCSGMALHGLLKLVRASPRQLKLLRAGHCLLSGATLVRDGGGRSRYRRACCDSLVRYGRGAGQG